MLIETLNENPVKYSYQVHDYLDLIHFANYVLSPQGTLKVDVATNFCYLDIADEYILDTFPWLQKKYQDQSLNIPEYFTKEKNHIGAHISLVYRDENNAIKAKQYIESNLYLKEVAFKVMDLISVEAFDKLFFALTIMSPELDEIRRKCNLPAKLDYHGLLVPFHITISTARL